MISCINIVKEYNLQDVKVLFVHKSMEKFASFLEDSIECKLCLASLMYDVGIRKGKFLTYLSLFKRALKKKKIVKKYLGDDSYQCLYVPSDDLNCRAVYERARAKNRNLKLYLIDDGVGTYSDKIFARKPFFIKLALFFALNPRFYENINGIYCYAPHLLNVPEEKTNHINVFKISQNISPTSLIDSFPDILKYRGKKAIFFDQGFSKEEISLCLKKLLCFFS